MVAVVAQSQSQSSQAKARVSQDTATSVQRPPQCAERRVVFRVTVSRQAGGGGGGGGGAVVVWWW